MAVLEDLHVWIDPLKRPGPESMAVDEWLLETTEVPVLRIYGWLGDWGSIGYFGNLETAKTAFPELAWVRRWTGGGTVDHRADWTYTLVDPTGNGVAELRGAQSYQILHQALAQALMAEDVDARLSSGKNSSGAAFCFENPVGHDLVDPSGRKLAGAGQRRTRRGLLHQGSVALPCDDGTSRRRSERLAVSLARRWRIVDIQPPGGWLVAKIQSRYNHPVRVGC